MNMVIPNEGKDLLLYWAMVTDGTDLEDFKVDLYTNVYTPVDASILSNFTLPTFTGYLTEDIARADFTTPAIVADVSYATATPAPTFTCTGGAGQNCYGWVMHGATSGKVIAAQRFDFLRPMTPGTTEVLTPFKFGLKTMT